MNLSKAPFLVALITLSVLLVLGRVVVANKNDAGEVIEEPIYRILPIEPNIVNRHPATPSTTDIRLRKTRRRPPKLTESSDSYVHVNKNFVNSDHTEMVAPQSL